jgi:hypothetical protein
MIADLSVFKRSPKNIIAPIFFSLDELEIKKQGSENCKRLDVSFKT